MSNASVHKKIWKFPSPAQNHTVGFGTDFSALRVGLAPQESMGEEGTSCRLELTRSSSQEKLHHATNPGTVTATFLLS